MDADERLMVAWLRHAIYDLHQAVEYLRPRDEEAAFALYEDIRKQVGRLGDFPGLGRKGTGAGHPRAGHRRHALHRGLPRVGQAYRDPGPAAWPTRFKTQEVL